MSKVPITTSVTAATRCATPTDRWYPYGRSRLGGLRMTRTATRNAIGGRSDSRSSTQATFIAWEFPNTRPTSVTATTRNPIVIHSNRMARRSAFVCFGGSAV
jgi:hypothetical protein